MHTTLTSIIFIMPIIIKYIMNLVKNDLRNITQNIYSEERLTIVKLASYLLIKIYICLVSRLKIDY